MAKEMKVFKKNEVVAHFEESAKAAGVGLSYVDELFQLENDCVTFPEQGNIAKIGKYDVWCKGVDRNQAIFTLCLVVREGRGFYAIR